MIIHVGFILVFAISMLIHPLNAQTWIAKKRLTWGSGNAYNPAIAVDSCDRVHVVMVDHFPGNHEIFYVSSTDGERIGLKPKVSRGRR